MLPIRFIVSLKCTRVASLLVFLLFFSDFLFFLFLYAILIHHFFDFHLPAIFSFVFLFIFFYFIFTIFIFCVSMFCLANNLMEVYLNSHGTASTRCPSTCHHPSRENIGWHQLRSTLSESSQITGSAKKPSPGLRR